jgi:RimJ/RimL family protein N-acetyltransferase
MTRLDSLEMDSLDLFQILVVLEDEYGLQFGDDQWLSPEATLGDLYDAHVERATQRALNPKAGQQDREPVECVSGLVGKRVALRPISPQEDLPILFAIANDPLISQTWRFRGSTPSPRAFEAALWEQVLTNLVVTDRSSGKILGLFTAYSADQRLGLCYLLAMLDPRAQRRTVFGEAAALFIEFLFNEWPFRKLYAEMPEYAYKTVESGLGVFFREEARLPEHHFHDGTYWDNVILAIHRHDWLECRSAWLQVAAD